MHGELLQLCRNAGFEPDIAQEATQWSTVVALVEAGLGVSIGPSPVARLAPKGCAARALPGAANTVILAAGPRGLRPPTARFAAACKTIY